MDVRIYCVFLLLGMGCAGCQRMPYSGPTVSAAVDTPTPQPPPVYSPTWNVIRTASGLDGKEKVSVSDNGHDIFVRCSPKFEAYVVPTITSLGNRLDPGTSYTQRVRYRLDDGPVTTGVWTVSDDFEALFIPASTLRKVVSAKKLTYEYKPDYVVPQETSISLDGLADALKGAGCKI